MEKKTIKNELPAEYLALCPLDGRYHGISEKLAPYFSEFAYIKNKVKVEVLWLEFLLKNVNCEILNKFDKKNLPKILGIYEKFSSADFKRTKEIESVTNHDTKAVELFVAEKLEKLGFENLKSFVHIGCTSEDISNTAYARMIKDALENAWIPAAENLIKKLDEFSKSTANIPMLAHTHGQPATPTTVGKELAVFVFRLKKSLENIKSLKTFAKFNGATGTYAAISVAFPNENWSELSEKFVNESLGLDFNPVTTQIESHDYTCHIADGIRHFNNVLLDFDVDMWLYISMGYFKQVVIKNEVGSSTMPHKVNPIKFENSEANIDMSNAIFMALSNKLPRSRMQRDLSDSSSQRNIGLGFGYSLQAIEQAASGFSRLQVNTEKLSSDLDEKWEVLAEPIQTMLRKYGVPDAYNKLKELTRGKDISKDAIQKFIKSLKVLSKEDRNILLNLTPSAYTGYAEKIAKETK